MTAALELLLVGLSHKTASLDVRNRCAVSGDELRRRLEIVSRIQGVDEAFLVSTCNRTEVLVATPRTDGGSDGAVQAALTDIVFRDAPEEALYRYRGVEVIIHLMRVASGLESLVLGEGQILAQLKEAHGTARALGATGRLLEPLLQNALAAGKRVRNETSVGEGTLSVARAGVDVALHVFGRLDDATVVVVGAGETGRLVARHLRDHGVGRLAFANRSLEHAEEAARAFDGEALPLERIPELATRAALVVTCVDAAPDLLSHAHLPSRELAQRDRPLVVVDLSVPRAVAPEIAEHREVILYDLDDIARIVDSNRGERQRASEEAAPILVAEVHKFLSLRTYASFSPRIARIRERFQDAREAALDDVSGSATSAEALELAHRLTGRLLDVALDELKRTARDTIEPESLDRAYQRFLDNQ